ncbi:MAG: phosphatase PAP2 family protein [Treponema sp.]|nr:phosphatase PAP2 family protein [Treponema sp.]
MNETVIGIGPAEAAEMLPPTFLWMMYEWGIEVIKVIQRVETPALTALINFIAALGTETVYVPLILFMLWWIDEKRGLRFGVLMILSVWINFFMKDFLRQPRPFNLDPSLGLITISGYGAPSGHAQLAMTFWIPMAVWLERLWPKRRTIIWAAAISFIALIGFTRLYLGVHFPTDLLAAWVVAGIILFFFFSLGPHIEKLLVNGGIRAQNISAAGIALLMNGLFPQERAIPALFLGFCLGYTMMKQRFPFSAREEINGKTPGVQVMFLRCLTGLASMTIIFIALRLFFPGEETLFRNLQNWGADSPFYDIGRFIRYGVLGFWASAGAPRLFQRMGLAQGKDEE